MYISLISEMFIVYYFYCFFYKEKLKVREIIKDLLDKNIIRELELEYVSFVLLVKKRDGFDRLCVDF